MSGFKVINTEEEFEAAVSERIKQERAAINKQYEGYMSPEDVQKKYKGYLSPDEVAKMDAKIKAYESSAVKTKIAFETGIPYELASRLSGDDEDAIRRDAAAMAKYLRSSQVEPPLGSTEPTSVDSNRAAIKSMLDGLKGE